MTTNFQLNPTIFLRSMVYILLFSQVAVNVAPYCYFLVTTDAEIIELYTSKSGESEEEEVKDELKDRLRTVHANTSRFGDLLSNARLLHIKDFRPLHHPEIFTPPPEC